MTDVSMELDQYFDFWIGMDAVYEKWAKLHNVTVNTIFTLYILAETFECTQSLVCEKLFLPKQTVNALFDSLVKSGYADKKISTKDRRSKIISLTPKGQIFADKIIGDMNAFEASAIGKMTAQERHAMIKYSQIYLKHLNDGLNSTTPLC